MESLLNAIAEPNRYEIVEYLREGPRSVNEIVSRLRLKQPLVSKHLRVLSDAGIVERLPKAQMRIYSLKRQPFEELGAWVSSFRGLWNDRLDALDSVLKELRNDED
jgi:DNA-binding transcriptional ArsR family regulator